MRDPDRLRARQVKGISTFALAPSERPASSGSDGFSFFDYVIDGIRLRELLKAPNVGVLSNDWDSEYFARQMLLDEIPPKVLKGRVQLYGCEICLDIGCGGIAAKIAESEGRMIWSEIARFETNYAGDCEITFHWLNVGPYAFDLEQYRSTLKAVLEK